MLFDTSVELVARGHKVSIVVGHDDRRTVNPEQWPAEVNRYYVPELMIPLADRYGYDKLRRTRSYRETLRYLQDIIDIEEPEIIHVHNFPRVEILNELRIQVPIVKTVHSYENLCGNHLKQLPGGSICPHPAGDACQTHCGLPSTFKATRVRAENRLMKRRFRKLIAVSSYVRDVMVTNGFSSEQIRVLNNFTRQAPERPKASKENLVLHVGRLTPEKGLWQLIESIALTRANPKLLVVGLDPAAGRNNFQEGIQQIALRLGVNIEFQNWCTGEELRRAYRKARVVAFSSVWPEPFGLVGIEAMMNARPVVAFECGGVRDWLQHGSTGFVVPGFDLRQYAYCLDQLLGNSELCHTMGIEAQKCAIEAFSAKAHIDQLLKIYMEVADEDSAHRPVWRTEICDAQRGSGVSV